MYLGIFQTGYIPILQDWTLLSRIAVMFGTQLTAGARALVHKIVEVIECANYIERIANSVRTEWR